MSDTAAAPAAPAPAAQTNGTAPGSANSQNSGKPTSPRSTDGRYSPKESAAGVETPGKAPEAKADAGPVKEAYRFKKTLNVYGRGEEIDLDEDGIHRELQISRANARKVQELQSKLKAREEDDGLAKDNLDEFLRRRGMDPDDFALKRVAKRIELEAMSEEARRALHAEQERDAIRAELEQRKQKEAGATRELQTRMLRERMKEEFKQTLAKVNLPNRYEAVYLVGETKKLMDEAGIQLSPDELATETNRRLNVFINNYLGSDEAPDAAHLYRTLGPKRIMAILEHSVAEHEKAQGISPVKAQPTGMLPEPSEPKRYRTEAEVDAYLKKLRGR